MGRTGPCAASVAFESSWVGVIIFFAKETLCDIVEVTVVRIELLPAAIFVVAVVPDDPEISGASGIATNIIRFDGKDQISEYSQFFYQTTWN